MVEDEPDDLIQYERDFPAVFSSCQVEVDIHPCDNFDEAFELTANPLLRYDLIISDTYKGPFQNRDAQVIKMVDNYRGHRFCPLVVYSSSVKPDALPETAFVVWADKAKPGDIERAISYLLNTNIPQLARKLHNDIERSAGSYLWGFLENKWGNLNSEQVDAAVLERLIRRRAALQIGRLNPSVEGSQEIEEVKASEYYIYPSISENLRLGEILKNTEDNSLRVVLTPHCHLRIQPNETLPRADYIQTVKVFPAKETILNANRDPNNTGTPRSPWRGNPDEKTEKLRRRIQSPAGDMGKLDGRYWFMPGFLDIPGSYCDFLQLESVEYQEIGDTKKFKRVATIDAPFAEALQSCFTRFYLKVGLPSLNPEDFRHLIDEGETVGS
ncbi:MAG: hypothetical protein KAQ89_04675 [Planctomycetes bacterium]|nr:hypothetical protein [Planctomycetota bacterium]